MDTMTMLVGGSLLILMTLFLIRLSYTILNNLINGRKFHESLNTDFSRLRLSKMLGALGINQTAYIYQTNVNDIKKQMESCKECGNTSQCDEELKQHTVQDTAISFCNNEAELLKIKQHQSEKNAEA